MLIFNLAYDLQPLIFPLAYHLGVLFTCALQCCMELTWVKRVEVLEGARCSLQMCVLGFVCLISG